MVNKYKFLMISLHGNDNNKATVPAVMSGGTHLSFRDWKIQKDKQKTVGVSPKPQDYKCRRNSFSHFANNKIITSTRLNFDTESSFLCNRPPPYRYNLHNSSDNTNACGVAMNFRSKIFGHPTNFNDNNINGHTFNVSNFQQSKYLMSGRYEMQGSLSDRFLQTDEFIPQPDMLRMHNPFRGSSLHRVQYKSGQNKAEKAQSIRHGKNSPDASNSVKKSTIKPMIFVRNPNRKDFKTFIPMPQHPDAEPNMNLEERKQQWRDYREAMKPFKNKDFYNAKRVVQRLGKKDPSELDEKEKFRLTNAQQKIAEYKHKLGEKHDSYVKSTHKSANDLGELFVLKKCNSSRSNMAGSDNTKFDQFENQSKLWISHKSNVDSDTKFSGGGTISGASFNLKPFL